MQKLVWKNSLGDEIDLTSGNYGITQWEGFSNTSLNIQSQQVPFQDGGVYLDSLINQRELSVTLKMQDNGNLEERYRMRRELIHILNPKLGEGYLIYTNDFISKRIKCVAQVPLFETHNSDTRGTPKASLAWTACEPYWEDLEETVVEIENNNLVEIENEGDVSVQIKANISVENDTVFLGNLSTEKIIETVEDMTGNIKINTNIGNKEIIKAQNKYNILLGGDFQDGTVFNNYVILCGVTLYKYNIFNNEILNLENNLPYQMISIAYSSALGLFAGICYDSGNYYLYTSYDLKHWTEITVSDIGDLISWEDSMFKIELSNSTFLKSTNGVDWVVASGTVKKNKTHIMYKNKYYRIYYNNIQESNDDSNWQNSFEISQGIGLFLIQVYDRLYAFGGGNTVVQKNNNENWNLLSGNVFYGPIDKSCKFNNKLYFIANEKYVIEYDNEEETSNIVLNVQGRIQDIISFNDKLYIAINNADKIYIYYTEDGIVFNSYQINIASYDFGNSFFIDKTNEELYYNTTYVVLKLNASNQSWGVVDEYYNWLQTEEPNALFVINEYNGAFYLGKLRNGSNSNNNIIYKTIDFEHYTTVYYDSALINNDICYCCFSDNTRIIFGGYAGLILYSENGSNFSKTLPQNVYTIYKISKIDSTYFLFGEAWNEYLCTTDFINFKTKSSPQKGTYEIRYISKYQNNLYYCGSLVLDFGFIGGDILEEETNIIDKISHNSDMNLNILIGKNVFTVKGSENTIAILKYRQKYIGV